MKSHRRERTVKEEREACEDDAEKPPAEFEVGVRRHPWRPCVGSQREQSQHEHEGIDCPTDTANAVITRCCAYKISLPSK